MMKPKTIFKFLSISLCIFCSLTTIAQKGSGEELQTSTETNLEDGKNKKKQKKDSIKNPLLPPVSIRFGTDLIGFGKTIFDEDKTELEINMDMVFYRYFLSLDYGYFDVKRTDEQQSFVYTNSGSFVRFGPDVNFLHRDPDHSALFFGLRYGRSWFQDAMNYNIDNEYVEDVVDATRENENLSAGWFEVVTGLKVKVWKEFMMGYTARFKLGLSLKDSQTLEPFDIPGYGRASEDVYWGFNYYLIYRLPIKKEKQIAK